MAAVDPAGGRDFFISYTWVNRPWAEWIAVELERAGYTTIVQAFDFAPGTDFVHEMQVAVLTAARTIAVLSPAYFESAMSEAEWRTVFAGDPSGELRRLVPVRVQPFTDAGLLRARVYIDLVDIDEDAARTRLLDGVAKDRRRPTTAAFPGGHLANQAVSPSSLVRFPGAGPGVSNLPTRNRNFSGRENILEQLHGHLAGQQRAAVLPTEALSGLGGVGKTALALEFGHRFATDYDICWWVPAEEAVTAVTALAALASELGIADSTDQDGMLAALFGHLRGRDRWLLIYDNAEEPDHLDGLLPTGGGGHVVVTSRWPAWRGHAEELKVGVLVRAESVAFLTQRTGRDDQGGFDELADLVGDLPLALEEAAAYLEQTGEALVDYLVLLRERFAELFDLAGATTADGQRRRVATVWSVSLDRVHADTPSAEALLNLLAFLAPEVPRTLPTQHPPVLPDELAAVVSDRLTYNNALVNIGRYSLATTTSTSIGLHRLVQAVVQARLTVEEQRFWAGTAVAIIASAFPDENGGVASWTRCAVLLPHVIVVTDHADRLQVAQGRASLLLNEAANYLKDRGQYGQAQKMFTRAVTQAESIFGPDHPDVGRMRSNLGLVMQDLGDLTGARTQLERALVISQAALGSDDRDIGSIRNNLGLVMHYQGDLAGARIQYERALIISDAALGSDDPTIGTWRNNFGMVLKAQGDLAGARTQLKRALVIGEATLGPDHLDMGHWRNNLGMVLEAQGDLAGARTEIERALVIGEAAVGSDHPFIATWRNNLGMVLKAQGDLAGARTQYEQALVIGEAALGPDHPSIGPIRCGLGMVLQAQGDLAGARDQVERALAISQAALGPNHSTTKIIQANCDWLGT